MSVTDIRPFKTKLREQFRAIRGDMSPDAREHADADIAARVRDLREYGACDTLLVYVSTDIEVDTRRIIMQALQDGKRVAVPRCVSGTRNMEFYTIDSIEDLRPGTFGVLEPTALPERMITDTSSAMCIVPALGYDWSGFRLGYGKGYYDRYLSRFDGCVIGICYSNCVRRALPHRRYDRRVSLLVTEKYIRRTSV